jgi:two-component system, NtrC family, response regulator HydG
MSETSILVVDDDIAVCRILHRMLSDQQYQVQISQSVADALAALEKKPFDVFVMDYKLPDGTGLDVAERIRSKGSQAPIILISGYDSGAVALRAEKLRISDIIEKPFSRATICEAVKKAIGSSPAAGQRAQDSVSHHAAEQSAKTKKGLPKGAIAGVGSFLLLLSCAAVYFFIRGH